MRHHIHNIRNSTTRSEHTLSQPALIWLSTAVIPHHAPRPPTPGHRGGARAIARESARTYVRLRRCDGMRGRRADTERHVDSWHCHVLFPPFISDRPYMMRGSDEQRHWRVHCASHDTLATAPRVLAPCCEGGSARSLCFLRARRHVTAMRCHYFLSSERAIRARRRGAGSVMRGGRCRSGACRYACRARAERTESSSSGAAERYGRHVAICSSTCKQVM